MATKIIINRKSEWLNRLRSFKIFIDDAEVGAVKNGSSEEFVVVPGVHSVYLKFSFYKSEPLTITVNDNETKFLLAHNGMKYFWALYILLLLALFLKPLIRNVEIDISTWFPFLQIGLIMPLVFYALYYLTIGRKKYLLLEEDHDNIFNS